MSYQYWYERISAPFRGRASGALGLLDFALVVLFAAAYVILLVVLAINQDARLAKAIAVPATLFVVVTVLRLLIDRRRPYETGRMSPIIFKDTRGKSMPSRHMASSVIIACTFYWILPIAGIVAFVGCALIAFTRIIGGVHYPADIIVATIIALAFAWVGYIVL